MLARLQPGFLLLFWCGIAATIVALPLSARRRGAPARPLRRSVARLALDLLFFPVLYAVVLEAVSRADLLAGAAVGAAHASLALIVAATRSPVSSEPSTGSERLRAFLARTLYGVVFAFLYVVPAP